MSVIQIPTSSTGFKESIVRDARAAQAAVNRMQMTPQLNPKGMVQPLGKITNAASEFQKSMDASAARVFAFGAAVGVINGISDAFKGMVLATAQVEKSLKDIQVVMEVSDQAMRKFGDGLFDVARNTATSLKDVAESATELARQGLSAEETLARVNSALVLSRLSGLDAVKSTETLTAAINSFNKEGITHEQIVNRMANVDAAFAVSSADLAEAISRAGAVAQSSGVSFNELSAVITAVQQRTARGGSVIGNGFKSIFTRIKRSGVRESLEEIGVATKNLDGSFRSGMDVILDYADVYKTLSDSQKAYTSEQLAGVYQIQNLQALLQDLNSVLSVGLAHFHRYH
jgi:TP901 family phage tail tape measure protein